MESAVDGWKGRLFIMDAKHDASAPLSCGLDPADWPQYDPEAIRALDRQLAELRAKGIISGGEGPRGSLKPVAYCPGALARFLAERGDY